VSQVTAPPAPLPPVVTASVSSLQWNRAAIAVSVDWRGQAPGTCTGGGAGCGSFTISGTCNTTFDRTITATNSSGQKGSARVTGKMPDLPPANPANLTRTTQITATALGGGTYRFNYTVRNNGPDAHLAQVIAVLHRYPNWLVADTFDSDICVASGASYTLNRSTNLPSGHWYYSAQYGHDGVWSWYQDGKVEYQMDVP